MSFAAGARLVAQLEDGMLDVVGPSLEPVAGFLKRCIRGWALSDYIDRYLPSTASLYFVDVGACIGSWGVVLADRYPNSHITCVEPYPSNYNCLAYNGRGLKNFQAVNVAVDEKQGSIRLSLPDINKIPGHKPVELWNNYGLVTAYGEPDKQAVEVKAYPLDDMFERVDFLKIDVEGMETRVLNGARRIMMEQRPILQIEVLERNQVRAGSTENELVELVKSFDYEYMVDDSSDQLFMPKGGKVFRI